MTCEKYRKDSFFSFIGNKNIFFRNSEIAILTISLSYVFWCFLFVFFLKFLLLVIFQAFINFRPKMAWHCFTYIDIIQNVFDEIFQNFV